MVSAIGRVPIRRISTALIVAHIAAGSVVIIEMSHGRTSISVATPCLGLGIGGPLVVSVAAQALGAPVLVGAGAVAVRPGGAVAAVGAAVAVVGGVGGDAGREGEDGLQEEQ